MLLSLIVGFVLGAGAIVFAIQNNSVVALSFLGWQFQSSLALVVIIMLGAGVLIGIMICVPGLIRRSLASRRLSKQVQGLHDEAETLRKENHDLVTRLQAETTPTPDTVDLRSTV